MAFPPFLVYFYCIRRAGKYGGFVAGFGKIFDAAYP